MMNRLTYGNLRKSIHKALARWDVGPGTTPQDPALVTLTDGIVVGNETILNLTLRPLDMTDLPWVDEIQSDGAGSLPLVERLSGVPLADLNRITPRDLDVLARSVAAHLQRYVDQLKLAWLNHGRRAELIRS